MTECKRPKPVTYLARIGSAIPTWKQLITEELTLHREKWEDVVQCTLDDKELNTPFDASYGALHGKPFTLWTTNRVYFPADDDGAESCESVPRNPCDEAKDHVGNGGA